MIKITSLFIFLISLTTNVVSQNTGKTNWIKNNSIKYNILRTSMRLIGKDSIVPSKYLIEIELTAKKETELKNLTKTEWLTLLNSDDSNWAANLLLYHLTKKDAIEFIVIKTQPDWDKCCRNDDIKYWENTLPLSK